MNTSMPSLVFLFFLIGVINSLSQNAILTVGGELSSSEGSVSFSIGQLLYVNNVGSDGSEIQGVQQPHELDIISIDEMDIDYTISVKPNPTSNFITLTIINSVSKKFTYIIFDANGRKLKEKVFVNNEEIISLSEFPPAVYFIKVFNYSKIIKSIKVLKK